MTDTARARPESLERLDRARSSFREAQHSLDMARRELLDAERRMRADPPAGG